MCAQTHKLTHALELAFSYSPSSLRRSKGRCSAFDHPPTNGDPLVSRPNPDPIKHDFGRLTNATICVCHQAERKLQGNFNQRTIVDVVRKEHVISSEKLTTVFLGANPFLPFLPRPCYRMSLGSLLIRRSPRMQRLARCLHTGGCGLSTLLANLSLSLSLSLSAPPGARLVACMSE